jgi:hypothetical protein
MSAPMLAPTSSVKAESIWLASNAYFSRREVLSSFLAALF